MEFETMAPTQFMELREKIGSSYEIASLMGVSYTTLYRWETGQRAIPGPAACLIKILAGHPEGRACLDICMKNSKIRSRKDG